MTNGLSAISSNKAYVPLSFKGKTSKAKINQKQDSFEEKKKLTKTKVATYAAGAAAVVAAGAALYKTGKLKGATNALKDAFDSIVSGFKKLKNHIDLQGAVSSAEKRGEEVSSGAISAVEKNSDSLSQGATGTAEKKSETAKEKLKAKSSTAAQSATETVNKKSGAINNLLFPNGIENLDFMQSNIGDCYLLSSVYGLSRNKKGQELLKNMVSISDEGNFIVKFHNEKPITILPSQLKGSASKNGKALRGVDGDLGLQAIECAYGKQQTALALRNNPQSLYLKAIKEGSPDEALKILGGYNTRMYGDGLKGVLANQEVDIERILNDAADNFNDRIICANTPSARFAAVKEGTSGWMDKHKVFDCSHAYNISNIDKKHKKVTVVNPHDTTKKEVLSFSEFSKIFSRIYETVI